MWKTPARGPHNELAGRRAALYHWRFSAPSRIHVDDSTRNHPALTHTSFLVLTFV